ncbi:MAG: ATP synthase F0 subunit C, partial [Candidatus Omnitrophica bacterium]|jgi:F-type H+-transporting ATPase subunit c|nr:ATP synthase F0 subunit C [Candidatus Omnitrophota bacterium]MDD5078057.1 ATP synthase F0 subunit C [Candidatus Omnitrophota bacterium]MDD5725006.1 ATP synthase F0 subunit C [Candidatus Omnitrophota bacterium]
MDFKSALDLGIPLALGVAAFGSAIGLGWAVSSALGGVSRQPESANKIMMILIIGCAFIEAITIYVLVFAFMYVSK